MFGSVRVAHIARDTVPNDSYSHLAGQPLSLFFCEPPPSRVAVRDEDRPYTSRRMGRTLRFALIAVAVLFAQHAAQLHAFSHFKREITQAKQLANGALPAYPQPQCLVLDAPGCPLPSSGGAPALALQAVVAMPAPAVRAPRAPRIEPRSQAPPARP